MKDTVIVLELDEAGRIRTAGCMSSESLYEGAVVVDSLPSGPLGEYMYINGEYIHSPPVVVEDIPALRANKVSEMSAACNATIIAGVDVTLSDGQTSHFSLALEDQLNLLSLQGILAAGAEVVPYHADGEECRYYSTADFQLIADAATGWKVYQESYFNSLRSYIQSLETAEAIRAVTYGMEIPVEYQTDVLRQLTERGK